MGRDFYSDDYGGDYYDVYGGGSGGGGVVMESNGGGGGGIDYGFDTTSWPTFADYYGTDYGASLPPDYAPGFGPETGFVDLGGGYVYDPSTGGVLDTGLWQTTGGGSDLFGAYFDYYSAQGYSDEEAMSMAAEQAAAGSILTETFAPSPPPELPDIGQYFPLPYVSPYDYWQSPPYVPNFGEDQFFPLPPPPSDITQPNLPPYCPAGQYHPYPIGHPSQNVCVPFPQAMTNAPKPPSGQTGAPAPAPKPQAKPPSQQQQQCPQGYYRSSTGQCLPIPKCTTPGTVFDQRTGRCVPASQAQAPVCPTGYALNSTTGQCEALLPGVTGEEDVFGGLKKIPLWAWLGLGALLLLSQNDGGGRTTTVRYRRAS